MVATTVLVVAFITEIEPARFELFKTYLICKVFGHTRPFKSEFVTSHMRSADDLEKLIDELFELIKDPLNKTKFEKWIKEVREFLKNEYGTNSKNSITWDGILDGLQGYYALAPSDARSMESLMASLQEAGKMLLDLLSELPGQSIILHF